MRRRKLLPALAALAWIAPMAAGSGEGAETPVPLVVGQLPGGGGPAPALTRDGPGGRGT